MPCKMPENQRAYTLSPRTLSELISNLKSFNPAQAEQEYPWADRFVMGLPLAPWQRDFKWSNDQCERFITSLWTGVSPGAYLVTQANTQDGDNGGVTYPRLCNMVIDGQQRLTALELYLTNKLRVPDAEGRLALWSDVDAVDHRRFSNRIFHRGEIHDTNEKNLREFYDLFNFGGVAHEENERASLKKRPGH